MDNWEHRSKGMVCHTCMYFNNYRCRRHAPTLAGWPAVYTTDWCGDHKLDKITMVSVEAAKEVARTVGDIDL